ncbi:MAG: substrate-binding domain-containing protein [Phycisphaerae bacterium]|nr:substrate-binding domain-containing protein [Phycisphaerae bacterium]
MSPARSKTTAVELAAAIRQRCVNCIAGMRLPGRAELALQFGCPESVVRAAVELLTSEGVLERRERGGCFVRPSESRTAIQRIHVLADRRSFQPVLQGILLGVSDECRLRRLDMRVNYDPPAPLDFDALARLAEGDPLAVGWVVALFELPGEQVVYSWLTHGIPFVVTDDYPSTLRVNLVTRDCRRAIFAATEKLIRLGHRRIALATPFKGSQVSHERVMGFQVAHEQYRLPLDPDLIVWSLRADDRRGDLLAPLLKSPDRPTGVVAIDQYCGCEILRTCDSLGLEVPREVSVVSAGFHPQLEPENLARLSCMDEGRPQRMGQMAVQLLLDSHAGGNPMALWLEPAFVDRGSMAPPKEH